MRRVIRAVTLIVTFAFPWSVLPWAVLPGSGSHAVGAAPCWLPPVSGVVTDPFRAPPCPYCAGNRGLEYRVGPNTSVRAVAAGTVSWSGAIAGVRYVVVRHRNGWRTTYGWLSATRLRTGDVVLAGVSVGRVSGDFHFGVRVGNSYIDPEPFLGQLERRPRLIPIDGVGARDAPPSTLRCQRTR